MIRINWFYEERGGTPKSGLVHRANIAQNSEIKINIKIAPDNKVVEFDVILKRGRVESVVKFSESPPAEVKTNDEVVKWVENNIDQLVQNALVKLLTTAVGFLG